jgi:hypothetical protein
VGEKDQDIKKFPVFTGGPDDAWVELNCTKKIP